MYINEDPTRIERLLAMDSDVLRRKIAMGLDNRQIYSQFIEDEKLWDYAVAAHIVSPTDAKWIKEHIN